MDVEKMRKGVHNNVHVAKDVYYPDCPHCCTLAFERYEIPLDTCPFHNITGDELAQVNSILDGILDVIVIHIAKEL